MDTRVAATCSAFPRTKALANAGSLPLGALVSPLAPAAVGAPAEEPALRRDPARCARCAAFVSPFCAVDTANGMWRCCFCGCDNSDAMFAVGASGAGGGRVVVCASGPATRGPGGVAADEDSELFDFEEKAAKEYVDELSITVSDDRIPLPVSSAPAPFGVQSHAEVR